VVAGDGGDKIPSHIWSDEGVVVSGGGQDKAPPHVWGDEGVVMGCSG
jgi:hypothetical protein